MTRPPVRHGDKKWGMKSNRLAGHELFRVGNAFDVRGNVVRGDGVAKCACGLVSPTLPSQAARQRWHRRHKEETRDAREALINDRTD